MGLSYARHPIRVLGVDPGLTRCGIGVVEGAPGRALTMVRMEVETLCRKFPLYPV